MKTNLHVAVLGSLSVSSNNTLYMEAYDIGNFLSREGITIVSCKESDGVMKAAYLGALSANKSLPFVTDPAIIKNVTDKTMLNILSVYNAADIFVLLPGGAEVLLYLSYILNQSKISGELKRFIVFGKGMEELINTLKENHVLEEFEIDRINCSNDLQDLKRKIIQWKN